MRGVSRPVYLSLEGIWSSPFEMSEKASLWDDIHQRNRSVFFLLLLSRFYTPLLPLLYVQIFVCVCVCVSLYMWVAERMPKDQKRHVNLDRRRWIYKYSRRRGAICPGHLASPLGLPDCNPITSHTLSPWTRSSLSPPLSLSLTLTLSLSLFHSLYFSLAYPILFLIFPILFSLPSFLLDCLITHIYGYTTGLSCSL